MKRRKAIKRMVLAGGAVAASYGGYEWFKLTKTPDLAYLAGKTELLSALAECIIPASDTPGAAEAGAVRFMMPILTECTDRKTLNLFIEGLRDLEAHTDSRYQKAFTRCTEGEKTTILRYFEEQSRPAIERLSRAKNKLLGRPFFETLKNYSVESYCISEKGASAALRYIAVPGRYEACISMEPNQKAWATN